MCLFVFQKYLYTPAELHKCSVYFCKSVTLIHCQVLQRSLITGGKKKNKSPCLVCTPTCCRCSCFCPAQPKLSSRHLSQQNQGIPYWSRGGQPPGPARCCVGWLTVPVPAVVQQGYSCTAPGSELPHICPVHGQRSAGLPLAACLHSPKRPMVCILP